MKYWWVVAGAILLGTGVAISLYVDRTAPRAAPGRPFTPQLPIVPATPPLPDGAPAPRAATRYPLTIHDVLGREVTIPRRPERIVSLAPAVTEMLFTVGAGDRIVGRTDYCDFPGAATTIPSVGGYLDPSVERVVARKPDLIMAMRGTGKGTVDRLAAMDAPLIAVDPQTISDVLDTILLCGLVTDRSGDGMEVVRRLRERRDLIAARVEGAAQRPRTLFLFSLDGLFSAGPGSHIDEMIRLAGGENIAAATGKAWPQLNMEAVVSADPQAIIVLEGEMEGTHETPEGALAKLRRDKKWAGVSAVRAGRVHIISDDSVTIPGPRLLDGLEAMSRALLPELHD